jgi:hypothetical protein
VLICGCRSSFGRRAIEDLSHPQLNLPLSATNGPTGYFRSQSSYGSLEPTTPSSQRSICFIPTREALFGPILLADAESGMNALQTILVFLHHIVSRGPSSPLFPATTFDSLCNFLVPWFHLQHPSRGSLVGPFGRLHPRAQKRAVDLAADLMAQTSDDKARGSLNRAVEEARALVVS